MVAQASLTHAPGQVAQPQTQRSEPGADVRGAQLCERTQRSQAQTLEDAHELGECLGVEGLVQEECGVEGNLMVGANVAGFLKVAQAMLAQGVV